jgi:hypothetical protein
VPSGLPCPIRGLALLLITRTSPVGEGMEKSHAQASAYAAPPAAGYYAASFAGYGYYDPWTWNTGNGYY